jgi:hypothetical protein
VRNLYREDEKVKKEEKRKGAVRTKEDARGPIYEVYDGFVRK